MLSAQSSTIFTKVSFLFYRFRGFVENKLSILVITFILNPATNRHLLSLLWVLHESAGGLIWLLIFWRLHLVHIAIVQIVFGIHRISQFGSWKLIVCNKTTWLFSSKVSELGHMIAISRTWFLLLWTLGKGIIRLPLKWWLGLRLKRILIYRTSNSAWRIVRIIWNLYILLGRLLWRRNWIG